MDDVKICASWAVARIPSLLDVGPGWLSTMNSIPKFMLCLCFYERLIMMPKKSDVEECKGAICELEISRIKSKVEGLELTLQSTPCESKSGSQRVCAGNQESTSNVKSEAGAPQKKQKQAFPPPFSFHSGCESVGWLHLHLGWSSIFSTSIHTQN